MLPLYSVVIYMLDMDNLLSEPQFREYTARGLTVLEALSVSVDRKTGSVTFHPPQEKGDRFGCFGQTVQFYASHSIGKARAEGLMHVYQELALFLDTVSPQISVRCEISMLGAS